ncbi:MAG: hypothetical protein R3D85_17220 [Paracoccaceae bacterium]
MLDQFGPEGTHGGVLSDRIALRTTILARSPAATAAAGLRLAVIAAGGGDDALHLGVRFSQSMKVTPPRTLKAPVGAYVLTMTGAPSAWPRRASHAPAGGTWRPTRRCAS